MSNETLELITYTGSDNRVEAGDYFAVLGGYGEGWATIIIPESDPRHSGMWPMETGGIQRELDATPETGGPFYGWRLSRDQFTVPVTTPDLTSREVRRDLPVEEAYPVGSVWRHVSTGDSPVTITGYSGNSVNVLHDDTASTWIRGALDAHGTLVSLPSDQAAEEVQEEATDPSLTTFGALAIGDVFANTNDEWAGSVWVKISADRYATFGNTYRGVPGDLREDYAVRLINSVDVLEAFRSSTNHAEELDKAREEGRNEIRQDWEEWKEEVTETAHRYADANSLCSEFDRCMEAIGLPTRDDLRKEWRITYTHTQYVTAPDAQTAREQADTYSAQNYGEYEVEESEE